VRECCPDTKLVAMSVKPEHEKAAQEYRLDGFISKQFPAEAFTALLNNLLSRGSEMVSQNYKRDRHE
jgi:DNA-binding NarL/FixJ family response regulator